MQKWKKAQKDFENTFKALGKRAWVCRLSDTAEAKALSGPRAMISAQPSDYIVVVDGHLFFAEVKSSSSKTSFSKHGIRPSQMAAARMVTAAGGDYYFFIKSEHLNKWFKVPAHIIIDNRDKASVKWTELEDYEWTSLT